MLTDAQFVALLAVVGAGFTGLVTAVRWGAGRVTKSIDRNTDAMLGNTESNAALSAKVDIVAAYVGMREREKAPAAKLKRSTTSPAVDVDVDLGDDTAH